MWTLSPTQLKNMTLSPASTSGTQLCSSELRNQSLLRISVEGPKRGVEGMRYSKGQWLSDSY